MSLSSPETLNVSGAAFASNVANFGGAIALNSGVDEARTFDECTFEENQASDGGALYFYTSAGLERIERSIFRGNYAGKHLHAMISSPIPPFVAIHACVGRIHPDSSR